MEGQEADSHVPTMAGNHEAASSLLHGPGRLPQRTCIDTRLRGGGTPGDLRVRRWALVRNMPSLARRSPAQRATAVPPQRPMASTVKHVAPVPMASSVAVRVRGLLVRVDGLLLDDRVSAVWRPPRAQRPEPRRVRQRCSGGCRRMQGAHGRSILRRGRDVRVRRRALGSTPQRSVVQRGGSPRLQSQRRRDYRQGGTIEQRKAEQLQG